MNMGVHPVFPADAELRQRESHALCEAHLKTWGRDLIPGNKISFHEAASPNADASAVLVPVCVHIHALCVTVSLLLGGGSCSHRFLGSLPLYAERCWAQRKPLTLTTLDVAFV